MLVFCVFSDRVRVEVLSPLSFVLASVFLRYNEKDFRAGSRLRSSSGACLAERTLEASVGFHHFFLTSFLRTQHM